MQGSETKVVGASEIMQALLESHSRLYQKIDLVSERSYSHILCANSA